VCASQYACRTVNNASERSCVQVCLHALSTSQLPFVSRSLSTRCRLSLSVGRMEGWSASRLCLQKQIGKNAR
jgi:hypothetical protein